MGSLCTCMCNIALSSQLCHDLSVRPLFRMCWANNKGLKVNWKQDVTTGGDSILTQLPYLWAPADCSVTTGQR